jgi:hypothetical protein
MDPKPVIDLSTLPQIAELELVEQNTGFPFPTVPPLVCSSLIDRLHVVTVDAIHQVAQHITFDTLGRVVRPVTSLPLTWVAGMTACTGALIVVGTRHGDEEPVVVGMDEQGSVQWQAAVPVTGTLALWPRPVCLADRTQLVWATGSEASTLWLAEVQAGACHAAGSLQFDDITFNFDVMATEGGLTLARVHGDPIQLELLRLIKGKLLRRATVAAAGQPVIPTVAVIADRYAVLWISRLEQELCLQWFDWDLRPTGPPEKLVSALAPARLRSARLIPGSPGYLAISYQTVTAGDGGIVHRSDGTTAIREPMEAVEQFVAAYDWTSNTLGASHRIVEPGVSYDAGGWVGGTLLLIHGAGAARISVYRGRRKE